MQISKNQVNKYLDKQLKQMFYQLVADIRKPEEAKEIFGDLLTETEMVSLIKRLGVAYWLTKKRSYEIIKGTLKISSATIASISEELKRPGWQMAIKKVMAEEWATKWETKIYNLFKIKRN